MTDDNDELVFAAEEAPAVRAPAARPWPILIVDDEPEVHTVTRLVLADYTFLTRPLRFLSAGSATEARRILKEEPEIAVILLDVVMESERAGLELVHFIREEQGNRLTRIILRTGQPGYAPEREVIVDCDINDYREKSELTAPRLFTAVTAALRAYRDLVTIEANRSGLIRVIAALSTLLQLRTRDAFLASLPEHLSSVAGTPGAVLVCWRAAGQPIEAASVVAASGSFAAQQGVDVASLPQALAGAVRDAFAREGLRATAEQCAIRMRTASRHEIAIVIENGHELAENERKLIEIFCDEAAIGFDNLYLLEQLKRSEQATVLALAKAAEFKDEGTGAHIAQVAAYAREVAVMLREQGRFADVLNDEFVDLIGLASVLHDVGKVGIRDAVLRKEGALDAAEWEQMRQHPRIGEEILDRAAQLVEGTTYLSVGAEIAGAHHERFDGQGYPRHLAGEHIPLAARILSVVDVFDALTSRRSYKEPWPADRALALLREQASRQFDPIVVDAFMQAFRQGRIRPQSVDASAESVLTGYC